jgi:MerR family copper efflux transcriptional regulator
MTSTGLLIGEVATRSGLSRKAIRLYEARGILPTPRRSPAGYRVYPADVLGVLAFITESRRLGLTLSEMRKIMALRCAGQGPCVYVRELLEKKITAAERMVRELRRRLDEWEAASRRQGVVCAHIEGRGGEVRWTSKRSVRRVRRAPKSSSKAMSSELATRPSKGRHGTAS